MDSVPINPISPGNIMYKSLSIEQIPKSQYRIQKEKKKDNGYLITTAALSNPHSHHVLSV